VASATEPGTGAFGALGLPAGLVDALVAGGIATPTPIQAATIPDVLAGRDVLGRAHTGSGKTLAFGLPLITRVARTGPASREAGRPRGLILLPTRELAQQVDAALFPLARVLGLNTVTVVGGVSIANQIKQLRRGVDLLIATPGRLLDLLDRRALTLDGVDFAVLDEADQMADLGFLPDVSRILDATSPSRQSLLYSATLDRGVDRLVANYLNQPVEHRIDDGDLPGAAIDHRIFRLAHEHKVTVATEIAAHSERTLFFVRTKHGADRLAKQLRTAGIAAGALHGDLNQNQRRRALDAFTQGRDTTLVATDVAARGIHVDGLDLVVHYDPPADPKVYAHRSGRTARAGASGTVLSLVEPPQHRPLSRMHETAGIEARTWTVTPGHPAIVGVAGAALDIPADEIVHHAPDTAPRGRTGSRPGRPNRQHRHERSNPPRVRDSERAPERGTDRAKAQQVRDSTDRNRGRASEGDRATRSRRPRAASR
jgi:superfamily II DNA/RNA helicase